MITKFKKYLLLEGIENYKNLESDSKLLAMMKDDEHFTARDITTYILKMNQENMLNDSTIFMPTCKFFIKYNRADVLDRYLKNWSNTITQNITDNKKEIFDVCELMQYIYETGNIRCYSVLYNNYGVLFILFSLAENDKYHELFNELINKNNFDFNALSEMLSRAIRYNAFKNVKSLLVKGAPIDSKVLRTIYNRIEDGIVSKIGIKTYTEDEFKEKLFKTIDEYLDDIGTTIDTWNQIMNGTMFDGALKTTTYRLKNWTPDWFNEKYAWFDEFDYYTKTLK